ncbi:unnamed protein product [Rotaria sordida]|uniref:LRAT domain-containing protein n=1 Tax=Rotaria sordida TaxID=392033 RepID=A0A819Q7G4_9BILA|nr:unnamed protein product [Rotaria sordida]CAF1493598.1 unnamed protein product [Rotaria sordida]CAF4025977.1 unnamed protein product [Rotaria sordida]
MFESVEITVDYLNINLLPENSQELSYPNLPENALYHGAHIITGNAGGPFHHGIVENVAPELTIIDFWGETKYKAKIQRTTLPAFIAGGPDKINQVSRPLYLVVYEDDNEARRQDTVLIAQRLLDDPSAIPYNIVNANCECFASYCRTGNWESQQTRKMTFGNSSLANTVDLGAETTANLTVNMQNLCTLL